MHRSSALISTCGAMRSCSLRGFAAGLLAVTVVASLRGATTRRRAALRHHTTQPRQRLSCPPPPLPPPLSPDLASAARSTVCFAARGRGGGRIPILPFIVQVAAWRDTPAVLLLYVLVRTGMLAVMGKVMLYGLLLIPLLLPILGAVGRYLVIPGQCPNCGVAFRAVRGKKTFACPACRTPIVLDGKSFVRAGPSWGSAAGAAGAAPGAATGAGGGGGGGVGGGGAGTAGAQPGTAGAAVDRKNYGASQEVIDVEVLDITSIDDHPKR